MATVSKQGKKWKCQVRRKGFPYQTAVFDSEQAAADWGDSIEDAMRNGTFEDREQEPPPETIKELLQRYRKEITPTKAEKGRADKARIDRLELILGPYLVKGLTSKRISDYKNDRLEEGAAAQTVLHELVILHHAYVTATQEWGVVLPFGIPKTKRPKLPKGRNNRMNPVAVTKILGASDSEEFRVILEFAIETCMRRSEITGIRNHHVSLENSTVFLGDTKTDTDRTVSMSPKAVELIRSRVKAGIDPIFSMAPDSITQAFGRAVKRVGLDHLRFHDTRHEGISRLFEKGLSMIEVSRISGHKTLSQLNRYTHLDTKDIVKKLAS